MLAKLVRATGLLGLLLAVAAPSASGATQAEIDRSIKAGTAALKAKYANGAPAVGAGNGPAEQGIGSTCLAGLALLEANVPAADPAVKAITGAVREASYQQNSTYQVALCLMYLDRYGDPADLLRIQMLGVRLLVGQTASGGWGYQCCAAPTADESRWLRGLQTNPPAGELHAEIKKYGQALNAGRNQGGAGIGDDNSNTQFGVLAVWMARKHGVPVEGALDLIEKRFVGSQDPRTGNWAYSGAAPGAIGGALMGMPGGSPSMYCAGLLGMATAVARREEKRKGELPAKPAPKPKIDPAKAGDPFYNPPAIAAAPKKEEPARPTDARDLTVQRAFAGLGLTVADYMRSGKGLLHATGGHGTGDLYFLWSMERAGVIYGVDKIGGFDWYDIGSTALVRSQGNDGSWGVGGYGAEVNTAFAVLFLSRSNLARDLSGKVQKDPSNTEMRAGAGPAAADLLPNRPVGSAVAAVPVLSLPNPTGDESIALASKMLTASGADWTKLRDATRDAKGQSNTRALLVAANNAEGDRKKELREALAERLCRMTPATLRTMLTANDAELRRAAALACAMKDDKDHVPDLVAAMADADASVVRAAKAGLKSLTGKDFATAAEWREWLAKEKK